MVWHQNHYSNGIGDVYMIKTATATRFELFDNRKTNYTAAQVKQVMGCTEVFNSYLYDIATKQPCCDIRDDGITLNNDQWGYYGYGWNSGELPRVMHSKDMFSVDNYLSCIWAIHEGVKQPLNDNQVGIGGRRGRTAFGFKADRTYVRITTSDAKDPMTLTEVRDKLFELGCVNAIILDGGGSAQVDTDGTTEDVHSSRIVSGFVCVWLKKEEVKVMGKSVYLSPSTQEHNIGAAVGYVEETEMNLIADIIEPELKRHGITVYRNKPEMSLTQVIADSNTKKPNLHLAVHSNAHGSTTVNKTARGCVVCVYRTGTNSEVWAKRILTEMDKIQPFSNMSGKPAIMPGLAETKNTSATAVIVEVDFHDNAGASWIQANRQAIADAIVKATVEQLGLTYIPRTTHSDPDTTGPTDSAWYEAAQKWVIEKKISDGTRPEDKITRAEVWQMLYNILG